MLTRQLPYDSQSNFVNLKIFNFLLVLLIYFMHYNLLSPIFTTH